MSTFLRIAGFEIAYYLRRISTHVYFLIFFTLSFILVTAIGGAFKSVNMAVGGSGGITHANAPHVLIVLSTIISLFAVIVISAVMGNSVYRDYAAGMHPLFFTTPIGKGTYLGGRFVGALVVNAFILLSIPLGALLASVMPWLEPDHLGPVRLAYYAQPYLVMILPNLLFMGAIFFALAALTRQMLPNYLGSVVLLVGYIIAGNLLSDIKNERMAALVDPFGARALRFVTKYWTAAEKNTMLVPFDGMLLWNRLLWIAVGVAVFTMAWRLFRFSHVASERMGGRWGGREEALVEAPAQALVVPEASRSFSGRAWVAQFGSIFWRGFVGIVRNVYFYAIAGAGVLFLVFSAGQVGKLYGTTTWPVTYEVVEILGGTFALFMLIVITFYSGELIWRERDLKADQLHDALPVPTWVPFAAKLAALGLIVVLLQGIVMVAGLATQAVNGYYRFEPRVYLTTLFGHSLVTYWLICVLAMLVHVTVNHKYMGHLIIVLYYVASSFMGQFGLEHHLYQYGSDTGLTYSDMNRFGPFVVPVAWFSFYWACVAIVLALITNLLWVRGLETAASWRLRGARARLSRPIRIALVGGLAAAAAVGGWIFYNTNVLNQYRTNYQREEEVAEYERLYKKYEHLPQPRITTVDVDVDLHPEAQAADVRGKYHLVNKTDRVIDSIHVRVPVVVDVRSVAFDRPVTRVENDKDRGYAIHHLGTALAPGEEANMTFDLAFRAKGFSNDGPSTAIVENGTFFNNSALPHLGYDAHGELDDDDTRKKHDLAPKERMAKVDDPVARQDTYISSDSDWVQFHATVSTDPDQVAIAPGYLQREWNEGGRHYFEYAMDAPILGFYSFLSARYAVKKDSWNDVAIEIYYHPGHEYNLDRMVQAVKSSLDYYTREFGPYQHRQVRILEFPRYAQFAQSFPNTIPFSEAIGFIARLKDPDDVDYPFYVTAHEVAHQWFAHQVIGGNVQGSTLMSETLAQYGALMVMEKEYGPRQMSKFLKYELDRYLTGRAFERKKEMPLLLVENQTYIHYQKGSLVMYALKDYLGEERLNAAIRKYIEKVKFQGPPYTNSLEFLAALREATPPELQYLLEDMFEHVTLYDLRTKEATYTRTPDKKYAVTITFEAHKARADETGNETEVGMDDLVDVGVFKQGITAKELDDVPLHLEKHRIGKGESKLTIVVDELPNRAGVDPYHKLIDRHSDDNVVKVAQAPST